MGVGVQGLRSSKPMILKVSANCGSAEVAQGRSSGPECSSNTWSAVQLSRQHQVVMPTSMSAASLGGFLSGGACTGSAAVASAAPLAAAAASLWRSAVTCACTPALASEKDTVH